jgi:hypothetical protein
MSGVTSNDAHPIAIASAENQCDISFATQIVFDS